LERRARNERFPEHDAKIEDVAWIEELITEAPKTYKVDYKRIYATGISNGGIFAQLLAIE
jgi:poly(3-hydroxybutyrate) depolymerase